MVFPACLSTDSYQERDYIIVVCRARLEVNKPWLEMMGEDNYCLQTLTNYSSNGLLTQHNLTQQVPCYNACIPARLSVDPSANVALKRDLNIHWYNDHQTEFISGWVELSIKWSVISGLVIKVNSWSISRGLNSNDIFISSYLNIKV